MSGSTDEIKVHVGPLYGVRKWSLVVRGDDAKPIVRLHALSQVYDWKSGWNKQDSYFRFMLKFPNQHIGYGAGLYGFKRPNNRMRVLSRLERHGQVAVGVMEMQGRVMVHRNGYRAEYARPVALGYQGELALDKQKLFAMWCQRNDIHYIGRVRSYQFFGVLARTNRRFKRGKLARKATPVPKK